jgi:hypothetical protein
VDEIPAEALLADYPASIREAADTLRGLVRKATPGAVERVRPGWRLIGYDVPAGRRLRYFAYVAPEPGHIHLGFECGAWMADPARMLEGAHLRLRKVRYLTFQPGQEIPSPAVVDLIREAARLAMMSRSERMSIVLDRDW